MRRQQLPAPQLPRHPALFRDNWLWVEGKLHLIDWERSGMNDPVCDLADLSVQADFDEVEDTRLLGLYHQPAERSNGFWQLLITSYSLCQPRRQAFWGADQFSMKRLFSETL